MLARASGTLFRPTVAEDPTQFGLQVPELAQAAARPLVLLKVSSPKSFLAGLRMFVAFLVFAKAPGK